MYAMQNPNNSPYQKYKQQSIMTMTQGEMLIRLFDEVIKQMNAGAIYIDAKDTDATNNALQKAQKIINYLRQTLDHQYEISASLDALYEYFVHTMVQANIKKDAAMLWEIMPMVTELRETFQTADRSVRMS